MEKNTILAVVLSTLVLIVFFMMQGIFFPSARIQPAPDAQYQPPPVTAVVTESEPVREMPPPETVTAQVPAVPSSWEEAPDAGPQAVERVRNN